MSYTEFSIAYTMSKTHQQWKTQPINYIRKLNEAPHSMYYLSLFPIPRVSSNARSFEHYHDNKIACQTGTR